MKKRLISAFVCLAIIVPLIITGGIYYNIGVYFIGMLALKEFLDIKSQKKPIPIFIQFIAYAFMTIILFSPISMTPNFKIDYRILSGLFLAFLLPAVFYHERKTYSINDAFYLIGGLMFLSISMSLLIVIRNRSLDLLIYLLLISMITDTYAYITGMLIGKHKLLESISPKKTIEGMIGGSLAGMFIGTMYYHVAINPELNIFILSSITLFLSVVGQLGDLVFSSIKRYFHKKDFSNLIPGHGGILDRLDSIIFVVLGFILFIELF